MSKLRPSLIVIVTITAISLLNIYRISASNQVSKPLLIKDGNKNPASIPDYVAYEFFFKSLVASPSEGPKGQYRVEAFAQQAGLDKPEIDLVLMDAYSFYQKVSEINRQIKNIKDNTWPNPDPAVWHQLRNLQKQKEVLIMETVSSIFAQRRGNIENKLRGFVNTHVKSRIKGYADQPNPGQHERPRHTTTGMVLATFFSPLLTSNMQMQGDETVYIYADATNTSSGGYVYGYGDVTASASSYGHEYSAKTEMYGPCAGQFYSSESGFLGVPMGLCDGVYNFYCVAVQSCPIANTIRDAGSSEDSTTVAPFFILENFGGWNPTAVTVNGGAATISISVQASQGIEAENSASLEFGYTASVVGSMNVIIEGSGPITGMTGGQRRVFQASYDPTSMNLSSADITAMATLTANGGSLAVQGSPKSSATTLRVTK